MSITAILSRGDGTDDEVDLRSWTDHVRKDELLWADVAGSDEGDIELLRRSLQLNDDAAEALGRAVREPSATVLEGAVEVAILSLSPDDEPAPIQIIVGDEWIITRHEAPVPMLDDHRDRITDQREVGLLSPVEFLASVLDWHVETFFQAAESLEREVDDLDEAALRTEKDLLDRMVQMRRRIARVRRLASVHREVFAELAHPDFLPELDERETQALSHVAERLDRAGEAISRAREMLIGTFDVHMTRTAQRTNDIMRVLTWASVILLPSVVIAGVMGMNFKVSIFDNPNFFFVVIGLMLLMAVVTLLVARWRRWL